jgi:hypothetical protein
MVFPGFLIVHFSPLLLKGEGGKGDKVKSVANDLTPPSVPLSSQRGVKILLEKCNKS